MAVRSKRIELYDPAKLAQVNPENVRLLEKYKVDMAVRDLAASTQEQYIQNLRQWFIWIMENQGNRSVLEMEDDDITSFLYYCKSEGNNAARMKLRTSVISAFYKFLRKKRLLTTNPTEFIESPKKLTPITVQTFLTPEQVALMREKLIEHGDTQLRLYATLSLSTMARLSAIASLRWNQVDTQTCIIHDVLEKEGKIVDLYFNEEVKLLLEELKSQRERSGKSDNGWVFYTGRTTPTRHINNGTLNAWCKAIGEMIGVPTLHPHDFRHSGATLLKNAGMSLEDVSVLLNHESTDTTKKFYIKQDIRRISSVKNRYNI